MADTGVKYCQTGASVSSAPYDDYTWTNPGNIIADDTSYAQITHPGFDLGTYSYLLRGTNFDFSAIPDGATIDGIYVTTAGVYINGSGSYTLCQLVNDSSALIGDNKAATPVALATPAITSADWGGETDKWGATLTSAIVKSSNFGVALGFEPTANDCDIYFDYIRMTVYYTESSGVVGRIRMII